jgi:hypothetical protein
MKSASGTGRVRCAIYTRVSTDQGLDQDFNSLDAQYEAASAYIKSQAHAGWTVIQARYMMAVTPEDRPTVPTCSGSWMMCELARSMSSSFTRSTG